MVFKTVISFICGLYRFSPVLPMGKTDCFTQFYPILPSWFYPLGKTTMPTLPVMERSCQCTHKLVVLTEARWFTYRMWVLKRPVLQTSS